MKTRTSAREFSDGTLSAVIEPAGYSLAYPVEGLSLGMQAQLLQGCTAWTVPAGRLLLPQDRAVDVCYGLAAGMLKLQRDEAEGRPVMLDLLEPGRWIGAENLLAGTPLPYGVMTMAQSTLMVMRRSSLQAMLECHPVEIAAWLALHSARQMENLAVQCEVLATGNVEERLCWWLDRLAERHGVRVDGFRRIPVRLTQEQLAGVVGTSRQRVNEALGALKRQYRLRIVEGWMEVAGLHTIAATPKRTGANLRSTPISR